MDPTIAPTTSATTTPAFSSPNLFPGLDTFSVDQGFAVVGDTISSFFQNFLSHLAPYSLFITLLFLTGIIYCTIRINRIRAEEYVFFKNEIEKAKKTSATTSPGHNPKWERAMTHLESPNPSDWRLAIIEADIMLEEMVDGLHLPGENLGEKLRNVEPSDFITLDKAWEAHKVRNQIAHQGADFLLSDREARRIMMLYRDVFNEFHYI
jgi:hypothetical protein